MTPALRSIAAPRAGRALLAALVALCASAAPAPAQRERGLVTRMVGTALGQLALAVADDPPKRREGPPAGLKPCGSLYDAAVLELAQGPELARSYADWILSSHAVIERNGGLPLPICFEYRQDTLTTNQGRFLLNVNARYLERRRGGFDLTGYADPAEGDTALPLRRAEWIQAKLLPPCRYRARRSTARAATAYLRKVHFSYQPAAARCAAAPPRGG